MKVNKGDKCCICGKPAVERAFDGTGWCKEHKDSWNTFYNMYRSNYPSLETTFQAWVATQKYAGTPITSS